MLGQRRVSMLRFALSCILFCVLNVVVDSAKIVELTEKDFKTIFGGDKTKTFNNLKYQRVPRQDSGITLISFLQQSVKRYGEKRVANSIHELAQNSLYDLVWLLAGDLEPWLIYDMYQMYNAASSDQRVLSVYERFRAGQVNRSIVPEVFALDKKYNEFGWYKNVRTRLLENVDKYMAGNLKVTNPPPKIEFGPDGKPIIEGKPEPVLAAVVAKAKSTTPKPKDGDTDEEIDDVEESPEIDLEDLLGGFIG